MNNNFIRTDNREKWADIIRNTETDFRTIVSGKAMDCEVVRYAMELAEAAKGYPENERLKGCLFLGVADDIRGIPSDCFCEYVLRTTVTGLSIIVYAKQHYAEADIADEVLRGLMRGACRHGFTDTGYDSEDGLVRNLTVMLMAGMDDFVRENPSLDRQFTDRFNRACEAIRSREASGEYLPTFDSHEKIAEARRMIIDMLEDKEKVFVYGTLLSGNDNHDYYLQEATLNGEAELDGYEMYDLGYYPGIVKSSEGTIKGELYTVDKDMLAELDRLEGKGVLYDAMIENIRCSGILVPAWVYVYRHAVDTCRKVAYEEQPWKRVM